MFVGPEGVLVGVRVGVGLFLGVGVNVGVRDGVSVIVGITVGVNCDAGTPWYSKAPMSHICVWLEFT